MKPIYFEVDGHLPLVVVPEVKAEMDGHPILTFNYVVYRDGEKRLPVSDKELDPNYLGTLTFEQPGKLFSYEPNGQQKLPAGAVQEIIEQVTYYRENPQLWAI